MNYDVEKTTAQKTKYDPQGEDGPIREYIEKELRHTSLNSRPRGREKLQ